MNTFRRCILMCGLMLALSSVAFAQSVTQSGAGNKMVSRCCACCDDSCDMTKKDAMKNYVMSTEKHECCGDSCDMKTKKDAVKNHANPSDKHDCCCGDSCDTKKKDAMKNHVNSHVNSSDKHEGCCCGDSCEMKNTKDTKKS